MISFAKLPPNLQVGRYLGISDQFKLCRFDPTERVQRASGAAEEDLVHEVRASLDRPLQVQLRLRKHIHGGAQVKRCAW